MTTNNVQWFFLRMLILMASTMLATSVFAAGTPIPIVYVLATDSCAAEEAQETATFVVFRQGPTNAPLTVTYQLTGEAMNGADYALLSGTVTIPAGAFRAPVTVIPVDDSLVEGSEWIGISLEQPLVSPPPYIVCWPSFAFAHIEDNDRPPLNQPPSVRIVSPPDGAVFTGPVDVSIHAQARDPDGRVHIVEFFAGNRSLGIVTNRPIIRPWPVFTEPVGPIPLQIELELEAELFPDFPGIPIPIDPIPLTPFRLTWEDVPPGEHVLTAIATDNQGASTRSDAVTIKVIELSSQPIVTVRASDPNAAEPDPSGSTLDTATFTVHRTGSTGFPQTVFYRLSGTASNGVDYRELPHSVTIPVGSRTADIVIEPIDDNLNEGPEKVALTLLPPVCIAIFPPPPDCYLVGRHHSATAVIHDNDIHPNNRPPLVEIVRPNNGSVFLAPADIALVAQARDLDGSVVTVEFFEGTNSLGTVTNLPATLSPTRPPFQLLWSDVPPGHYVLTAKAIDNLGAMSRSKPVEIKVSDVIPPPMPIVTVRATDPYASEGGLWAVEVGGAGLVPPGDILDTATFTVTRDRGTNLPLAVLLSFRGTALNQVDYEFLRGHVTIPAGQYAARVEVVPVEDNLVEGTETVILAIEPIACARVLPPPPECYLVGEPSRATAYIRDNDTRNEPPRVAVTEPKEGQVFVAPADVTIEVEARDPDGWVQTVEFFAGTNSIGEQSIYFIIAPPPGLPQRFSMIWSNVPTGSYRLTATATDHLGAATRSEPVEIKVLPACRIPVVTVNAADNTAAEQDPRLDSLPDTAVFRLKHTCVSNADLLIRYSLSGTASNGVDYQLLRGHVTIPAGAESADILIEAIDDILVEGTETVVLRLEPPDCPNTDSPPAGCYLVGHPSRDVAYIRDNDLPPNEPPRVALVSPPSGSVFRAPADILLVANARDADGWVRTVEFFEGTRSLGVVTNNPLILSPNRALDIAAALEPMLAPINPFVLKWENVPPGEYELTAVATDNDGASTPSEPVKVIVAEAQDPTVVTVVATDPKASEGSPGNESDRAPDTATFTVKRTGPTNLALLVLYRLSGTASNGIDYQELPNAVTIPAGARTADIVVEPIDDTRPEGTETILLTLAEPICIEIFPPPPDCYLVGRSRTARAVIHDNDGPANEPPSVRMVFPQDGETFLARADIALVAFGTDAEDGYQLRVEFFEGTNSLGLGTFNPTRCATFCPNYILTWSNVPPGHYVLTAVATDSDGAATASEPVEIKVSDHTPPPLVTIIARDGEAREMDPRSASPVLDTAAFTVRRTGPTNDALIVHYRVSGSASNGVDYERLHGQLSIPAGAQAAEILVVPVDDPLCEGDESVIVSLLPAICIATVPPPRDCYYAVGEPSRARAVVHDNEVCPPNQPPKVAIVRPENGDTFPAGVDLLLCAEAKDRDGRIAQIEFFEGNRSLGTVRPDLSNQEEILCLRWSNVPPGGYVLTAVGTDNLGASTRSEPVRIRVLDRSARPVVTIVATDPIATEERPNPLAFALPDAAIFTVRRNCCTNAPLTVRYQLNGTASNGLDYVALSGQVSIPAGSWETRIAVVPLDDQLAEGTETVIATLRPSVCVATVPPAADCYVIGHPGRALAYIRDNETDPNIPPHVAVLIPDEGQIFPAPGHIEITAVALDPDGWVPLVEFFEGTNKIGESQLVFIKAPPPGEIQVHNLIWSNVPPGHYTLTAKATDDVGGMTESGPIHISVVDPCATAIVTIEAADAVATEGDGSDTATFRVRRNCQFNTPLLVHYQVSGTASPGTDYTGLGREVLIPAGQESALLLVRPIDDRLAEGTETIIVTLEQLACIAIWPPPPDCYLVGQPGRAVAYLRDDEQGSKQPPIVSMVRPRPGAVFHAGDSIGITAHTADPDGWVTTMQFFEGTNQIGGVAILVSEPPPPGQRQSFSFMWEDARPGRYLLTALATDNDGLTGRSRPVEITVVDRAHPPVVTLCARDAYAVEGAHPANTATFLLRRSGPTNAPLTVHYALGGTASNGRDYQDLPASVTIPAGRRTAVVVVSPIDDRLPERVETVILRLQDAALYNVGHPGRAGAMIVDNDYRRPPPICWPDRVFTLCLPGFEGFNYRLEATTDFITWEALDCGSVNGVEGIHFVDTDAPDLPQRFYRAVEELAPPEEEE